MDSLIIHDKIGIIQWASATIFQLLGYLPEELHGREIFQLVSKTSLKMPRQVFHKTQKHSLPIKKGLRKFLTKEGKSIPIYVTVDRLRGKCLAKLVLLHLQLPNPETTGKFILSREKAGIEVFIRKHREYEMAAELHDHINPNLVSAKLLLDYSLENPLQHLKQLEKASAIIKDLIHDIRNLSHTIINKAGKEFGLREALYSLQENFKNQSLRIVIRYDGRLDRILDNRQKIHLVRIIQEQLMNVIKHASASKILISLQQTGEKITVVTRDNGKGFDPTHQANGMGIKNMFLRVNELNGNLHINSKWQEGTSIRIVFPMDTTNTPYPEQKENYEN